MRTLALALVIVAGCSPTIRSGHYRCMDDSQCPPAARYCREGVCVSTPGTPDDSGSDLDGGGEMDAFVPPPIDAFMPMPDGSRPCTTNGDCMAPGALCIRNLCRRPCGGALPACTGGDECVSATANGGHGNVCLPVGVATEHMYDACGTCEAPFECVQGNCLRDCNGSGDRCLSTELCIRDPPPPSGTMRQVCLQTCPSGGGCPAGMPCVTPPMGSTQVCIAW